MSKKITTYSAKNGSPLVWLAVLLLATSIVTRISYFSDWNVGFWMKLGLLWVPLVASIVLAIRLPLNGQKQFYVTVNPFVLIMAFFIANIATIEPPVINAIVCYALCAVQLVLYFLTFSGKLGTKAPILVTWMVPLLFSADPRFRYYVGYYWNRAEELLIADLALYAAILLMIAAAKKLPEPVPGEPCKLRYGDRCDGRLVRSLDPITKLGVYFMPNRNGASNLIRDSFETSAVDKYIRDKRNEGLTHFGFMHVMAAAYVRLCRELPGINRFISGQKIYSREDVIMSLAVKKEMSKDGLETIIKARFSPEDNAADVYRKLNEQVEEGKAVEEVSAFDKATIIIDYIPGILKKFVIWLLKTLDYFGLFPFILTELSPFHGSFFLTSMGSLGIPAIYHHLYDFGNIPVFCAFGAKRSEKEPGEEGAVLTKKYIDYTFVTDERIVDGYYFAQALRKLRFLLSHPERLDEKTPRVPDFD